MLWCDKNNYTLVVNSVNYNPNSSSSLVQYPSGEQGALTIDTHAFTGVVLKKLRSNRPALQETAPAWLDVSPTSLSISNYYCSNTNTVQTRAWVSIYPNPAADYITVILGPADGGTKNLVLYNSIGQEAGSWNLAAGENKIDVSSLPEGIYSYTTGSLGGKIVIER